MRDAPFKGFVIGAVLALMCLSNPSMAQWSPWGVSGGVSSRIVCLLAGGASCTMTGSIVFSGVTTDITTPANEDLSMAGGGTGAVFINDPLRIVTTTANMFEFCTAAGSCGGLGTNTRFALLTGESNAAGKALVLNGNGDRLTLEVTSATRQAIVSTLQAAAGVNMALYSAANASGEYGVVLGTSDTSTAVTLARFGVDLDGTPAYKLDVYGDGKVEGTQVTTGTPATWRVPTAIANDTITHPTCSTSADAGRVVLVDDSNDGAAGVLCVCRAGTDDATYALVQVADNTTACIDP